MKNIVKSDFFLFGIIFLFILRMFLNGYVPLMDTTEARYSEIARIMLETDNWVTPQIDYGVPFWAKPPLSTWLSAASMKLFGVNEFAVRLPYLILSLLLIILVAGFAKRENTVYLSGFILMTIPEFLLHAGVVSTDTALSFCVAMIFLSFWKAVNNDKLTIWGYLFFVFIGLGLLAKGPIVLLLTIPPVFLWILYFGQFRTTFRRIPLFSGSLLTLVIAVPWYYLAEVRTKGFLEYFIVGEHFRRFFDSSWKGDMYGFPKSQPVGMIWLFLFVFAFPWIQVLIARLWARRKDILKDRWMLFLLLWLIWTPLFFTVSKSLIHTYILPVMIPIALLADYFWNEVKRKKAVIAMSLIFPAAIIIVIPVSAVNDNLEMYSNSDKYLIEKTEGSDMDLYYFGTKSYSSQFYSRGQIQNISNKVLQDKIDQDEHFKVIIRNRSLNKVDSSVVQKLQVEAHNEKSKLYLFKPQ